MVGLLLRRAVPVPMDGPVLQKHCCTDLALALGMGMSCEGAGPSDVAVAGRVVGVAAFAEDPFAAVVGFAQGKIVGGDILFASGEALLGDRELVHEREA